MLGNKKKSRGVKLDGKEGVGPQPCFRSQKLQVFLLIGELLRHIYRCDLQHFNVHC